MCIYHQYVCWCLFSCKDCCAYFEDRQLPIARILHINTMRITISISIVTSDKWLEYSNAVRSVMHADLWCMYAMHDTDIGNSAGFSKLQCYICPVLSCTCTQYYRAQHSRQGKKFSCHVCFVIPIAPYW